MGKVSAKEASQLLIFFGQHILAPQATPQEDPLVELEHYFDDPLISCSECVDLIAWWGVSVLLEMC